MNRKLVSNALTGIDEELIAEAMEFRAAERSRIPERNKKMKKKHLENHPVMVRRGIALALAACLVLALAATAYALNLFGLRELYANPNRGEMPQEAQAMIETQQGTAEGEGFQVRITESYCDENTILLTLSVTADEGYVLADSSEDPFTELQSIGLEGEGTLEEYALGQERKLLFVGASLPWENLGINDLGQQAVYLSDREMVLYLEATKSISAPVIETVCQINAQIVEPGNLDLEYDPAAIQRLEIPLTMTEGAGTLLGVYTPEDPQAVPGLELGELRLERTPLGISLRLTGVPTDGFAEADFMTLRVEGLEFHGNGSLGLREDGSVFAEYSQGQGEAGDTLTVTFLDWDKESVGTVTFVKK